MRKSFMILLAFALGLGIGEYSGYRKGMCTPEFENYVRNLERVDSCSRVLVDRHNLPDIDGSDEMSELLDAYCGIDSFLMNYCY